MVESKKSGGGSKVSSTASSGSSAGLSGVPTGVGKWQQMYDEDTGRFFFFDKETKATNWGLPLKEVMPEAMRMPHSKVGESDWVMCIDPQSGKKFYQSVKISKVQWTPPLMFRAAISKLPYFNKRVSIIGAQPIVNVSAPAPAEAQANPMAHIEQMTIDKVLGDSQTCAAFHRFLVASLAEENNMFWGAAEVYRVGKWKGMTVLGQRSDETMSGDDEGDMLLQEQFARTRASVRIGFTAPARPPASEEARLIYDKFLKPNAEMEVCVERKVADAVLNRIQSKVEDKRREIFIEAQRNVEKNMAEDLLPRFLRCALGEGDQSIGSGEKAFTSDAVVREALVGLAEKPAS